MSSNVLSKWVKKMGEQLLSGGSRRSRRLRSGAAKRQTAKSIRPAVETLEDRVTPSTFNVTDLADTAGSASDVTLRYAITTSVAGDTVTFDSTITPGTITTASTLTISHDLTITGPGAASMAIDGAGSHEVLSISAGATVSISGLTIQNGIAAYGSGIYNNGTLSLTNDAVSNNGSVTSTSTHDGGGVYNVGTMTITDTTINGNAVYYNGGGIFNSGTMTVSNSTIFGNAAYTNGGGIDNTGTLTLSNDTISGSFGWSNSSAYPRYGGGLYNATGATATMTNTIVDANHAGTDGTDVYGTVTTANYDLIGTTAGYTITTGGNNQTGVSSSLATSLASNGGPTQTLALNTGSPAIGAGQPSQAGTTAQNGVIRPGAVDIGAYQTPLAAPTLTASTANLPVNSTSILLAGANFDTNTSGDTVTFDHGVTGTVVSATSTSLGLTLTGLSSVSVGTAIHASVTVDGVSSGSPVQVATVSAATALPVVTSSNANLAYNAPTITINGSNFDANSANDTVAFNLGAVGTVTSATTTQLTVTFSTQPNAAGSLTAVVTVNGSSSGLPVPVATVVGPTVTPTTTNMFDNAPTVTITGTNFDPNPANDTVVLNLGAAGTVTAATATQLTVTLSSEPSSLGSLTAVVTSDGASSGAPVQVATVVPVTWIVTDANGATGSGSASDVTLPYAVANAQNNDAITFDASLLTGSVINLTGTLTLNHSVTITGLGAANLAVSGGSTVEVFNVATGVTATISGMTIENGSATGSGGGIYNHGTLTLSNDVMFGNTAHYYGGAVYNSGTLTLNTDTLISNGSATNYYGGAVYSYGTLTILNSTLTGNTAEYDGGAIFAGGTMTITNSTIANNTTTSSFSYGGGVYTYATVTMTNDTISGNASPYYGGGIDGSVATMTNTIVAGNTAPNGADMSGTIATGNDNLIGVSAGVTITSGTGNLLNVAAGLSPLADNGGPTQTMALLSSSPAIDAGTSVLSTDQRGVARGTPAADIGAYQFAPAITASTANLANNYTAMVISGSGFDPNPANDTVTFDNGVTGTVVSAGTTFLGVTLSDLTGLTLGTVLHASATVDGISTGSAVAVGTISGPVVYPMVTTSSANLADTSTTLTINGSNFDPTAANNTVVFNRGLVGTVTAATATQLTVTITTPPTSLGSLTALVTTNGNNSGAPLPVATEVNGDWIVTDSGTGAGSFSDVTLPYAVATYLGGDTISFSAGLSGSTITPSATVTLNKNVTVTGLGAANLAISGGGHEVFNIAGGTTASISGLTIENGLSNTYGGGIYNHGTLTLSNDVLTGNLAHYGAAIYSPGTLTLNNVTIAGNGSSSDYYGGGIYTTGTATIVDSTISGNTVLYDGGGIYAGGTLTVTNSTIANNTVSYSFGYGGGIYSYATLNFTNDTISGNSSGGYGGGYYGTVATMQNTIVAGNSAPNDPDAYSTVATGNDNLIGNNTGLTITSGTGNLLNVSPALSPLASNGGPTQTMALLPTSPAIDAGTSILTTDQRGVARGTPASDIGAYQVPVAVTPNTGNLPVNATSMLINGVGFDPNLANDTVTFDNGVTGTVATATSSYLIVNVTGVSSLALGTVLNASVTADGISSGAAVAVGTIGATAVFPVVTSNTANLPDTSTTLTIAGSNFDTTAANNTVLFNLGVVGTVTSATSTQLTVTISAPPTALGSLTAIVVTDGALSGIPVQVGTEVNGNWVVTDSGNGAGNFGDVTLPYAVANYLGGDTISFASSLSGSTIAPTGTLVLGKNVTVTGLGAANLAVTGSAAQEVFNIGSAATVSISGLTIENGSAGSYGGGIYNHGTLTLSNDVITGNTAHYGAGIYSTGTITLDSDTISGNGNSSDYYGGGLYTTGTSTITNTTMSGNTVLYYGGAIYNTSTMTLSNSTLVGNSVTYDYGGAIYTGGTVTLTNDTIALNHAGIYGGGIYTYGTITMDNTIVAGNTAVTGGADIYGTIATANYDMIGTTANTTITTGANNILNVSPGLAAALANNGGSTQTLALVGGSPALGNGDPGQSGTTAQNGLTRPSTPDIGAYQGPAPVVTPNTANLPQDYSTLVINGSNFDTNPVHDSVTFDNGVTGTVVAATSTTLTVTLTGLNAVPLGAALDAVVTADGQNSGSPVQVATIVAPVPVYSESLDASGNLVITEIVATDNSTLSFSLAGGTYTVTDANGFLFDVPSGVGAGSISGGGTASITIPSSAVTGTITVTLGTATNVFTIGATDASVAPLSVNAGTTAGDKVIVSSTLADSGDLTLTSTAITLGGGSVTTTGAQTYNGAVTLAADTTTTGSAVTFAGTVDSTPGLNVITNSGFETGDLTGWNTVGTNPTPSVTNTFAHTGTYSAFLGDPTGYGTESTGDSSITQVVAVPSGSPQLTFWVLRNSVDSISYDWQDMRIYDSTGTTLLATPMHICTTDSTWTEITVDMTPYAGTSVTLMFLTHGDGAGDDTNMYVDDVTMLAPAHSLTVSTTGAATFGGAVGGTTALNSLTVGASAVTLTGNVSSTGAQIYNGPVTLGADTTTTGSAVTFASTIDSGIGIAYVNALTNPGFETGDLTGWTTVDTNPAPSVTTAFAHTGTHSAFLGDPTGFGTESTGDSSITQVVAVPSGSPQLTFWVLRNTVDSVSYDWQDMRIYDSTGTTLLATPMHICTTDSTWTEITVDMTPYAGTSVTLMFLTHGDGAGDDTNMYVDDVTMLTPVTGVVPRNLTVNASGTTTFGGVVGGTGALASLTTDAPGTTVLGSSVTTVGAQTYNDPVTLPGDATLTSTGSGNITFGSTVDGAHAMTVDTAGVTAFHGTVGGTTALTSLTTDAPGSTVLSGALTTSGAQTYNDPVTLGADTTTNGSNVTFASTVDAIDANIVANPGFETGDLTNWTVVGTNPTPSVTNTFSHSGTYSAKVGDPTGHGTESLGDSSITQVVAVPAGSPQLTFWVLRNTTDSISFDWQDMRIYDSTGTTLLATPMHTCTTDSSWTQITVDMTPYAGTSVTLMFLSHGDGFGDNTNMYVDDVSLSGPVPHSLTVNATGATTFGAAVGGTVALSSVTDNTATLTAAAITTVSGVTINDSGAGSITGTISGGGLVKQGAGTLTVSGTSSVTATVSAGTLADNGTLGDVTVSGGVLGGSGTTGAVINTATVNPGLGGSNILNTGNLSGAGTYSFDLNGTTAGTGYDQLNVTGSIDLTGATLGGSLGYTPALGDTFTIIHNVNNTPITGTFTGYAEGATVTIGSATFTISYVGGAGNDVTLTRSGMGAAPAVTSVVINGGAPAYTDSNGFSFSLAGQNSVVEQILVTFNEAVTLDPGAFTITNDAAGVTVNNGPTPNTAAVTASFAAVSGSGGTEYIVTFSGPGTTAIPGGVGAAIKDGLYILNTVGSHVHANAQTAADNNTTFWALYGSVVGSDNNLSSTIGDGTSEVFVDNFDYSAFKAAFGAETDIPLGVPYSVGLDGDLNGFIDNFDYSAFKGNFGADWSF